MKKLLLGLSLLTSITSFAKTGVKVTVTYEKSGKSESCYLRPQLPTIASEVGDTGYIFDFTAGSGFFRASNKSKNSIMTITNAKLPLNVHLGNWDTSGESFSVSIESDTLKTDNICMRDQFLEFYF